MRIPVRSSSLAAVAYDPVRRLLEIVFRSGATYVYAGVPREIYEGLLASPSKGRFFLSSIRNGFRATRRAA